MAPEEKSGLSVGSQWLVVTLLDDERSIGVFTQSQQEAQEKAGANIKLGLVFEDPKRPGVMEYYPVHRIQKVTIQAVTYLQQKEEAPNGGTQEAP